MAAYHLDADTILDWTPAKIDALAEARARRNRTEKLWQIAVARIPSLAEPEEYINDLVEGLLPWEEYVTSTGARRLDEMSDAELQSLGVKIVDKETDSG